MKVMASWVDMTTDKLRQLEYKYGLQRVQVIDPASPAEMWAFRHRVSETSLVTVCTIGAPQELCCTVFEPDLEAAAALLRVALRRQWTPGRVWINGQPLLTGTNIQGLVASPGDWMKIYPLTEVEAEFVAEQSLAAITIAEGRDPLALLDLFRSNTFPQLNLPTGRVIITSKLARTAPLRSVSVTSYGRYLALTQEEPAGYLDDPDNVELLPVAEVLPRIHGAGLLFVDSRPGESLRYTHQGWEYSVT